MIEKEWPYRARWTTMLLATLFFAACAAVLGHKAATHAGGLTINGVIQLGVAGARTFYWVLTGLSAGFVVLGAFIAVQGATSRQRIAIGPRGLTLPASRWRKGEVVLPLPELESVRLQEVYNQRFVELRHAGKKYTIAASMLPTAGDFDVLVEAIVRGRA
jgi:hypothetical protein